VHKPKYNAPGGGALAKVIGLVKKVADQRCDAVERAAVN
jgi:hypothetical protein